ESGISRWNSRSRGAAFSESMVLSWPYGPSSCAGIRLLAVGPGHSLAECPLVACDEPPRGSRKRDPVHVAARDARRSEPGLLPSRSRRLRSQALDPCPIARGKCISRAEPRATRAQHVRQLEIRSDSVLRNAARWTEARVRKR